jgi:bifunctional DNA-binding transcriptional regulator/antitoxin component of YhaV-PrlF toxin-antitoxin module
VRKLVKLQKRFAYKYKDKEHYKYVVTVPEESVKKLGWKEGQELEQVLDRQQLVIRGTNSRREKDKAARE